VGRNQTWNNDDALTAARRLFRMHGYQGTSLRQVEQATGVHPGSLYRTYGDKRGLFEAALRSYNVCVVEQRVFDYLRSYADPLAGVHAFFQSALESFVDDIPGCLVTNTAVESLTLDPAFGTEVQAGLRLIEDGLTGAMRALRDAGRLAPDTDPITVAGQLLALYQGLLVLVRCETDLRRLHDIAHAGIDSITGIARTKGDRT